MSIRIDGTNTTANPGITGGDADTGLQFGTDEIQFVTGGTNRATVESNGNFTIENGNLVLASGSGIDFSADSNAAGMTSELLDDYEEGTWTPSAATGTVSQGDANYVKIGNYVYVTGYVRFDDTTTASDVIVNNLPFTVSLRSTGAVFAGHLDPGKVPNAVYGNPTTTNMYFYISGVSSNYIALEHDEISSGLNQFFFSLGYRTNT